MFFHVMWSKFANSKNIFVTSHLRTLFDQLFQNRVDMGKVGQPVINKMFGAKPSF